MQERLLYRLSQSNYKENFCLKGGALLYALGGNTTRFTKDIDFLGKQIANSLEIITNTFSEICKIHCESDGVWFNSETIQSEFITENDKYNGIRLQIESGFEKIKQRMQIDIGFGDIVTPASIQIEYPVLLSESEVPIIQAYSIETVIAEKFQAMIELSSANSRMKDFYDVYNLLNSGKVNKLTLNIALKATFKNRNTNYSVNHNLFTDDFILNPNRLQLWKAFLSKIAIDKDLEFSTVMQCITEKLKPFWEDLKSNH